MDMQILINYLGIFILPFVLGGTARFLCRGFSKAWLISAAALVLSLAAWLAARNPPVLGSELYILRTVQCVCFMTGSLLAGLLVKRRR